MKTITVTTLRSINYGGVVQAYALHTFLKNKGVDNKLLDYCALSNLYVRPRLLPNRAMAIALVQDFFYFLNQRKTKRLMKRFNSFINKNIETTESYGSYEEITSDIPEADLFITGSDQVFGVRGEYDDIRMLQFVPSGTPCVSYAASLGEYDWSKDEANEFNRRIQKFDHISVREQYAADYLKKSTSIDSSINIDPVFLLDKEDYDSVVSDVLTPKEPYILCYSLVSNDNFQKVIDEVKQKTGYQTVCIHTLPMKRVKTDKYVFDAGPAEFLSLIKNAEFVITSSFHGTALSIIFEKPFLTLIRNYKSQRITELLEKFGLSDRIYSGQEIKLDVDYSKRESVISQERNRTANYFKKCSIIL